MNGGGEIDLPPPFFPPSTRIEVAAGSSRDAVSAASAGADRIELCTLPSTGGVTPAITDVLETLGGISIPLVVLLRPRSGSFVYDRDEISAMAATCRLLVGNGVSSIATGALTPRMRVDSIAMGKLIDAANGAEIVFHRAFDSLEDQFRGLNDLIELGVRRILTSGNATSAVAGVDRLARLTDLSRRRVEILPGGGIRASNAAYLVQRTGTEWIHGSFSRKKAGTEPVFDAREFEALLSELRGKESDLSSCCSRSRDTSSREIR